MGYTKKALSGISWVGVLRLFNRGIGYVKLAILARLLTPEQFGIFGIATLVLAFLEIITETGVNVFLIQEKENLENYIDTAWVVSIGRGALISLLLLIASPTISNFFNSPKSLSILLLIATVPFIRGFINPASVNFQKELNFSKEFYYRLALYFIDAVISIGLAIKTHSPIALVIGMMGSAVIEVFLSHIFLSPHPKLSFESTKISKIINRGKWITAAGFFNYLYENIDDGAVGRILDTASLGYYQMAYKIASLPITEVSDVVNRVTFPIFVKISSDKERLKKAYLKSTLISLLAVVPIGIVLFVFSKEIVTLVLGNNWLPIVPVIKVMAFFGTIRIITESSFSLFLSVKKQEYVTITTLIGTAGLAVTIIPFIRIWGVMGAGISALMGAIITLPVVWFFFKKL